MFDRLKRGRDDAKAVADLELPGYDDISRIGN